MLLYHKSTCSTCRRARALLDELGIEREERDMSKQPLSESEIRALIGDRDVRPFLNPRNEQYRELKLKDALPPRDEVVRLLAANPNLVRRPLLVDGDRYVFGLDEAAYRSLAGR